MEGSPLSGQRGQEQSAGGRPTLATVPQLPSGPRRGHFYFHFWQSSNGTRLHEKPFDNRQGFFYLQYQSVTRPSCSSHSQKTKSQHQSYRKISLLFPLAYNALCHPGCSGEHLKIETPRSALVASWLGFQAFAALVWVQSLIREMRSRKQCSATKNKKTKTKETSPHVVDFFQLDRVYPLSFFGLSSKFNMHQG